MTTTTKKQDDFFKSLYTPERFTSDMNAILKYWERWSDKEYNLEFRNGIAIFTITKGGQYGSNFGGTELTKLAKLCDVFGYNWWVDKSSSVGGIEINVYRVGRTELI